MASQSESSDAGQASRGGSALEAELQRRTAELDAALARQAATAEILKVIASSQGDVQPVFDAIAESARRLSGGLSAIVTRVLGDNLHLAAFTEGSDAGRLALQAMYPKPVSGPNVHCLAVRTADVVTRPDIEHDPTADQERKNLARMRGFRSLLVVPLLHEGRSIGTIGVARGETGAFDERIVELLKSFADQAVIAIENARLFNETKEALERQTATADILKVIASSPSDVQPVFQAIADRSNALLGGLSTAVFSISDDLIRLKAFTPTNPEADEALRGRFPRQFSSSPQYENIRAGRPHFVPDTEETVENLRNLARMRGYRSMLFMPLMRGGAPIGMISVTRVEAGPFSDQHVQLLQTFADQAVIAIENVRLFNETKEALERQTATADVLKVIASSPSDVHPVFQAIAERANRLLDGLSTAVFSISDDNLHLESFTSVSPEADAALVARFPLPVEKSPARFAIRKGEVFVASDVEIDWRNAPDMLAMARLRGFRSLLYVPLVSDGRAIGTINVTRAVTGAFVENDVRLLQTFADQAVIAIENVRLFNETKEALERQTASADVLRIISRSVADATPVFEAILDSCHRLFSPYGTAIYLVDGEKVRGVAGRGFARGDWGADETPLAGSTTGEAIEARRPIHIIELADDPHMSPANSEELRLNGGMSVLYVPLMSGTRGIGSLVVARMPRKPFVEHEIDFICAFADQAVIAIENARLFEEVQARTHDLEESLSQQTATAEVLQVISRSAFDLDKVLHTLLESAARLCDASICILFQTKGDLLHVGASYGGAPDFVEYLTNHPHRLDRTTIAGRAAVERRTIHIPDIAADTEYGLPQSVKLGGWQSIIGVPLLRDGEVLGVLDLARPVAGPFTQRQIELIETFADQAVIAIENARLFEEVQAKTKDLEESLQFQTATSDVLKVISRSPDALQPVLDAIVDTSRELCGSDASTIFLVRDGYFRVAAVSGPPNSEILEANRTNPVRVGEPGRLLSHVAQTRRTFCIQNILDHPVLGTGTNVLGGPRALLVTPLIVDEEAIGVIVLRQSHLKPFTQRQIDAVATFADQAVIAISNVRLFEEVQAKTHDLQESLQQQTATADVLKVISRSAFDLDAVMNTLTRSAAELCKAEIGALWLRQGDVLCARGIAHTDPAQIAFLRQNPLPADDTNYTGRTLLSGLVRNIGDVASEDGFGSVKKFGESLGFKAILFVPLMREGRGVGVFALGRNRTGLFSRREIEVVQTFADQAVIAIENVRLFDEVQARTSELSESLEDLRSAQDRLVQTEKLASLGQLTAGIAHEIKNPLNFVNNFAALSADLTEELNEILGKTSLDANLREEVDEISQMLKSNLEKIAQHGKRADSIVKNMLLHSREGSGERRPTDVNALVDEALNLAYHGARAEKPEFNVTLHRDFDPAAGEVALFPQEITRVLLNLVSNGFYAGARRKEEAGAGFEPALRATTKDLGDRVEIRIRDNGAGIPPEVKEKMFNPFFTTKPPGEGTGLGLSMSHDIVVKQHGGAIDVATEQGAFTEFVVVLPRAQASAYDGKTGGRP